MNIQLLFDTAVLKIFGKSQEKNQWRSSYCTSFNKHTLPPLPPLPRRLSNFETGRFLLEGGVYFTVSEIDRIIIIKTLPFLFQNKN